MRRRTRIGAVIYDPKVKLIWDIIKDFFDESGYPVDYVLYSNYDLLVEGLCERHVEIAWNSPLAWVDLHRRTDGACRAVAMRDSDRDRVTHIIVRRDDGIEGPEDLRGRTIATGAWDSPQAHLLPIHLLRRHDLVPDRDIRVRRHDLLVGLHGDHIGGELEALRDVQRGEADACAVLDLNWERWQADGTTDPNQLTPLISTEPFDHCNFSVLADFPGDEEQRWSGLLLSMSYENPRHREMMDLEGLRAWLPGRTTGYTRLTEAADEIGFFEGAAPA
jgi:phosphonate transport system substrate-binding protein